MSKLHLVSGKASSNSSVGLAIEEILLDRFQRYQVDSLDMLEDICSETVRAVVYGFPIDPQEVKKLTHLKIQELLRRGALTIEFKEVFLGNAPREAFVITSRRL